MRKNHSKIVCIKLVHLPYLHRFKLCSIVAACVSSCDVCTECRAAARHSVHTPQLETHAATILHNL